VINLRLRRISATFHFIEAWCL